jgi:rfaE bifunctional protein nucleotidyltransferase chain/domain/rfaE bifunctional protein kinase chain/domain
MNSLVVVGDSLLDRDLDGSVERLCPDAPVPVVDGITARTRPGGAALAATLAANTGRAVTLITALADDEAGAELGVLLDRAGVDVVRLELAGSTPEKIRVRAGGRTLLRLDRGGPGPATTPATPSESVLRRLASGTVLVSDYGRGMTFEASIRSVLASRALASTVVWDPHPRGASPVRGCTLITPNREEARLRLRSSLADATRRARQLARSWCAGSVAITLGAAGAVIVAGLRAPLVVPAPHVAAGDPCGAGDCFAMTAAAMLADGATVTEAAGRAVASASAFVAAGGAATSNLRGPAAVALPVHGLDVAMRLSTEVRARGGRIVATGGCFDLLHAGHIAALRAARSLGDCLIVCLNSDASVRRLKGVGRPLVPEQDRADVLAALGFVDAVVIFEEPTPAVVLQAIQPDIFAKGADYGLSAIPEARLLSSWGGEAVLVPYLEGRSTSRIVEHARAV